MHDVADLAAASTGVLGATETMKLLTEALERIGWPQAGQPPVHYALASDLVYRLADRTGAHALAELAMELIARVPAEHRPSEVLHALSQLNYPGVIEWMEKLASEPVTYEWGTAAAVNGMDWPRVERWLLRGQPLARIALDALISCCPYDPATMSGVLRDRRPTITGAPSKRAVQWALKEYSARDGSKAVRDAVDVVLKHLDEVLGLGAGPERGND
jgi:hypothetical protein